MGLLSSAEDGHGEILRTALRFLEGDRRWEASGLSGGMGRWSEVPLV